jgi:hypothetical protein
MNSSHTTDESKYWSLDIKRAIVNDEANENEVLSYFNKGAKVYLAKGNKKSGISHILSQHKSDFKKSFNLSLKEEGQDEEELSSFLYGVLKDGAYMAYGYEIRQGESSEKELCVTYQINEDKFLKVAIGSNGFIVTATPTDKQHADKTKYSAKSDL